MSATRSTNVPLPPLEPPEPSRNVETFSLFFFSVFCYSSLFSLFEFWMTGSDASRKTIDTYVRTSVKRERARSRSKSGGKTARVWVNRLLVIASPSISAEWKIVQSSLERLSRGCSFEGKLDRAISIARGTRRHEEDDGVAEGKRGLSHVWTVGFVKINRLDNIHVRLSLFLSFCFLFREKERKRKKIEKLQNFRRNLLTSRCSLSAKLPGKLINRRESCKRFSFRVSICLLYLVGRNSRVQGRYRARRRSFVCHRWFDCREGVRRK